MSRLLIILSSLVCITVTFADQTKSSIRNPQAIEEAVLASNAKLHIHSGCFGPTPHSTPHSLLAQTALVAE
jgi:hypothetical protein